MDSRELRFTLKASVIRRLGEEVGPDEAISIAELIKNSYDADASTVTVEVSTDGKPIGYGFNFQDAGAGYLKITDNGKGIAAEEMQKRWMNFALSPRAKPDEAGSKRTPIGGKGMGRSATAKLGRYVELFTRSGKEASHVAFDWSTFDDRPLHEVPVFYEPVASDQVQGTTIFIFPLLNPGKYIAESGENLISKLRNKIASFTDRNAFQVSLSVNGQVTDLGPKPIPAGFNQAVYFEIAWRKITQNLKEEILEFWNNHHLIHKDWPAEERVPQVAMVVRSQETRKIVGLSTAMEVRFKQLNNNLFYYYRSIVLPEFRQPGLASKVIVETRKLLEHYSSQAQANRCIGMITFVENAKLQQAKRETIWPASGMMFMGTDSKGRHIRVCYFALARI